MKMSQVTTSLKTGQGPAVSPPPSAAGQTATASSALPANAINRTGKRVLKNLR
jgi:hypothetical protein